MGSPGDADDLLLCRPFYTVSYNISIRLSEFGGDEKAIREMVRRALEGGSGGGPEPGDDE